jgi:SAM-dependent methyltransferase
MSRAGAIGHDQAMPRALRYRKDLYQGTAEDYDRYRPPYPDALLADLRARVPLRSENRLLDLACGPGRITFSLAAELAEVVSVDQEVDFVELGRRKARQLGCTNTRWVAGAAETVPLEGEFDLVAIGDAFHRLDRDAVAVRLVPHLSPGGCVALLWGCNPWNGDEDWQVVYRDVLERWQDRVGARDRVPAGWEEAMDRDPHADVLRRAGLAYEGERRFVAADSWTVESLIGFTYSTSFLSRAVLGDLSAEFEQDLRERMLAFRADGRFDQELDFAYELARKVS